MSTAELSSRICFLERKFQKDLDELKRQFQLDCEPLRQLHQKKTELQKINEKLAETGYVDPAEESESDSPDLRKSVVEKSFSKQRTTPSNPPQRSQKKSISPMKQISKTGNDFYSRSRLDNCRQAVQKALPPEEPDQEQTPAQAGCQQQKRVKVGLTQEALSFQSNYFAENKPDEPETELSGQVQSQKAAPEPEPQKHIQSGLEQGLHQLYPEEQRHRKGHVPRVQVGRQEGRIQAQVQVRRQKAIFRGVRVQNEQAEELVCDFEEV